MLKFEKVLSMKITSFLVAVIFILNSTTYGIDTPKNTFSGLRVPLITQNNSKRLIDGLSSESLNFKISERDKINASLPESGQCILRAINFMHDRGLLSSVYNLKVIRGADKTSAEIIEDTLILKLSGVSFITEKTKNEAFLYLLFIIARSQTKPSMLLSLTHSQGQPQDGFFVTKNDGIETLAFRDEETGHIFMLAANFENQASVDKKWVYISPPSGLFKAGGNVIINSAIVKEGIIQETSSRQYPISTPLRYQIGIFSGGCEIFRLIPKDSSTEFAAEDMDTIFGMPEALNQAIKLFCSGGIFKERNDIWRFSVPRGHYDKVKTEFSDDGERKRLTVQVPLDASLSLVEAIEVLAKAFEKTDLSYLYASTENEQIRSAIREAEKNINKEKEAVLAAIRETWEYKKTLYVKMVKPRQIDEVTSKWLEQNAPNLKDRVIISWQLEMGFHPELSLALLEVMQKEVDKGGISIQDADILLKKISMSTMAGGLGALMPDLVRGMADNGASVVALNMIYDRYEDGTEAGKWLKETIKSLEGYSIIKGIELEYDGKKITVDAYTCRLGGALQVWIDGSGYLYEGNQNSHERASQMKLYNAAGQAVIKELRSRGLIAQGKKLIHLENEAYTHLPKEEGAVIIVNHTVVAGGMPNYLKSLFSDLVGQYGDSIFDRSGRLRLEVLGAIRAMKIIGVSIDHTRILKEVVFPESLRDVGANKEMIAEILSKIVMDNEYGSSNGTHPKHFQAPEAQNLIDKYKTQFGNATMDDNELIAYLEADPAAKDQFMEKLDSVTSGLETHLLALLRTQGIKWSKSSNMHTGAIIRRIVDYKELRQFINILQDGNMRERFKKSGVRVIIGGRFGPDKLAHIRKLAEAYQLQDQVAVFENYNISDAPIIMQGVGFTVMLSQKGKEASATTPQKVASNGGAIIAVADGICHPDEHFLEEFNSETGKGNGFIVEYDEHGIPTAESLLGCFEKMGNVLGNEKYRRQIRYNSLVAWMNIGNIATHQARGILKIMDGAIAEQIAYSRINYTESLSKGREVDPVTKTTILTGEEAKEFLLQTKEFPHQTTVCNLEAKPMTVELGGSPLTLGNAGTVAIKPGAMLDFKEITGQVMVIVTHEPNAVNDWYRAYNFENFAQVFTERDGYNESGIVSPKEWTDKGVVVLDSTGRMHQWTGEAELEWLIDAMTLGTNLAGVSIIRYDKDTAGKWIYFDKIRQTETYHKHPDKFIEIYYVEEGMMALAFLEDGEIKINIMGPGDMMIVKDALPHAVLAAKGPYRHVAVQLPSAFQYGFEFKETLDDFHALLQKIAQNADLDTILVSSGIGTYVIRESSAVLVKPSISLLSSL